MQMKYLGPNRSLPGFGKVGHGSVIEVTNEQVAEFGVHLFEATEESINILPFGSAPLTQQAVQKQRDAQLEEDVEAKRQATEERTR